MDDLMIPIRACRWGIIRWLYPPPRGEPALWQPDPVVVGFRHSLAAPAGTYPN